ILVVPRRPLPGEINLRERRNTDKYCDGEECETKEADGTGVWHMALCERSARPSETRVYQTHPTLRWLVHRSVAPRPGRWPPGERSLQASATTSRISTWLIVTPGGVGLLRTILAAFSASAVVLKTTIERPFEPSNAAAQYPLTSPGACLTWGTMFSRSTLFDPSNCPAAMVTVTTTACMRSLLSKLRSAHPSGSA